jgi:transposase-like protein
MLDRDDKVVVTAPVDRMNARTLQGMMKSHIHVDSTIMTDEGVAYNGLDRHFKQEEYVRGDVHTNTIEGFWSLLKRGLIGIYHQVSVDHLHRYCSEFEYRYNTKKMKDAERFSKVLTHLNGRLMYKSLINN